MTARLSKWRALPALALLAACSSSGGQSAAVDAKNAFDGVIADVVADVAADAAPADVAAGDAVATCDLAAVAAALAGPGAVDCGHATLADPITNLQQVYGCAVAAMKAGQNVFALIDEQGIDSKITKALLRRPGGAILLLNYDSQWSAASPFQVAGIEWQGCKVASFARPAGVDALFCESQAVWSPLCPLTSAVQDQPTQVTQWTPSDVLVHVQPHQAPAYPPYPTQWIQLKVQKGAGPCPPGATCSWTWTVDANGAVTASPPNASKQLSPADVQTLWELLGPPSFLTTDLKCPPPPTDIGYTMSLYVNDTQTPAWTQDVTGCVISDAQSMPAQVMKLLQ